MLAIVSVVPVLVVLAVSVELLVEAVLSFVFSVCAVWLVPVGLLVPPLVSLGPLDGFVSPVLVASVPLERLVPDVVAVLSVLSVELPVPPVLFVVVVVWVMNVEFVDCVVPVLAVVSVVPVLLLLIVKLLEPVEWVLTSVEVLPVLLVTCV